MCVRFLIPFFALFHPLGHSPLDGKDFTVDGINGFGGKKKKKKRRHSRTIFTSYQLDELEKGFYLIQTCEYFHVWWTFFFLFRIEHSI